jgi:hypothetical protein
MYFNCCRNCWERVPLRVARATSTIQWLQRLHACGLLIDDAVALHVMARSFMTVWLKSESNKAPLRPGRRRNYIDPIVD